MGRCFNQFISPFIGERGHRSVRNASRVRHPLPEYQNGGILLRVSVLLLLFLFAARSAAATEGDVWITVSAETLPAISEAFEDRHWPLLKVDHPDTQAFAILQVTDPQIRVISRLMHLKFNRCGGFQAFDSLAEAKQGINLALVEPSFKMALNYTLDRATEVNAVIADLGEQNIIDTITHLSSYTTRYYTSQTGVDAANWLKSQWEGYAGSRSDISVSLYNHSWAQPSVVMTITGAHQPQDIVVIGGHLDSINLSGTVAPGADDDASGIATISEIVRAALANGFTPARTVKFIAYAAEEVGLRGSAAIAQDHQDASASVIGVLNLDMTNFNGSSDDIYLIQDNTNAAQNTFLGNLVDTYTSASWSTDNCGYACSDHASWHQRGFAASMPFEAKLGEHNQNIHTANDTLSISGNNAAHAMKFAQLGAAYLVELAKGGINGNPGSDPGPVGGGGSGSQELTNGQTLSDLSGATGSETRYFIDVPSGASNLVVATSGGSGDVDLYLRQGAEPTTGTYDCRPYQNGNNETCTVASPVAGTYHIMLRGYSAYSGTSLTASYSVTSNQAPAAAFSESISELTVAFTDTSSDSDGSISSRSWDFGDGASSASTNPSHSYASAGTYTVTLTVVDDDGASDSATKSIAVAENPGGGGLENGETVTGLSGSTGQWQYFTLDVPAGASNLTIAISGGSGDADLYTRFGAQPTTSTYDCRPYRNGNNETCNIASPAAGTHHIGLRAYSSYASVTLTVSYTEPGSGCSGGFNETNLSGSAGSWQHFTIEVPACANRLNITMSGGTGDGDLYTRFGAQPTTNNYQCRPYVSGNNEDCSLDNPNAGTWYISIRGYSAYSGVSLDVTYQ